MKATGYEPRVAIPRPKPIVRLKSTISSPSSMQSWDICISEKLKTVKLPFYLWRLSLPGESEYPPDSPKLYCKPQPQIFPTWPTNLLSESPEVGGTGRLLVYLFWKKTKKQTNVKAESQVVWSSNLSDWKALLKKQVLRFDPGSTEPERLWSGPGDWFCLILSAGISYIE